MPWGLIGSWLRPSPCLVDGRPLSYGHPFERRPSRTLRTITAITKESLMHDKENPGRGR